MTEVKNNFNTEPLVLEIENVINKGLKKILKDYINKYDLLEQTHKQIMMLPSVVNDLNKNYEKLYKGKEVHVIEDSDDSDSYSDLSISDLRDNVFNKDMTKKIVRNEVSEIKQKIEEMEKNFNSFLPLLTCISLKIQTLSDDIKNLKDVPSSNNNIVETKKENIKHILLPEPFIVTSCENENIKFEIKEEEQSENEKMEEDMEEEDDYVDEADEENEADEADEVDEYVDAEEEVEEDVDEGEQMEQDVEEDRDGDEEEKMDTEEVDDVETEVSTETITKDDEQEEIEEEEELVEIEIDDVTYCTNNEENGFIYELTDDGEVGDKVGYLKEGEPFFYADEK